MRSTTAGSTNPWGTSIDEGWKDLVVSSAPPPPPPLPRDAAESPVRNRALPADITTWQEHGSPRVPSVELPVEEPSFTAADRRLWLVAGTLMGLAALVLAVLGMLTFGGVPASVSAAIAPAAAEPVAPAAADEAPATAAHASSTHVSAAMHASAPHAHPAATVATRATNPRVLKSAAHSSRSRKHKRIAAR